MDNRVNSTRLDSLLVSQFGLQPNSAITTIDNEIDGACTALKCICEGDIKQMKKKLRQLRLQSFSTMAEIPRVQWNDIAGLDDAKEVLRKVVGVFEKENFPRRSSILLYGPPGTGKTMLAKAVATEYDMNFISIKGPELLDIYIGQSEANIRELFKAARAASPCIIFFDELDSIGVSRGRDGDAGGVTDRLVSQLLLEMDSLVYEHDGNQVFLIGATNRPDLLDPALIRPGRFDCHIFLGCPVSAKEKAEILRVSSQKYLLSLDVDFETIATWLKVEETTPAMLANICHNAMRSALRRAIAKENESTLGSVDYVIPLSMDDYRLAIDSMF